MAGSWRNGSFGRISTGSGSQSSQGHNSYSSDSTDSGYGDMPAAFYGRSSGRSEKMTRQDFEELEKLVEKYFDKKFSFAPPLRDWKLPEPREMFVAERWKVSDWKPLSCRLRVVIACWIWALCSQQFTVPDRFVINSYTNVRDLLKIQKPLLLIRIPAFTVMISCT